MGEGPPVNMKLTDLGETESQANPELRAYSPRFRHFLCSTWTAHSLEAGGVRRLWQPSDGGFNAPTHTHAEIYAALRGLVGRCGW